MANFTHDLRSGNSGNAYTVSGSGHKGGIISFSSFNDIVTIPKYSTITAATLTVYFKETTNKTGNADIYVYIMNGSTYAETLAYGDGAVPKNNPSTYASRSVDLLDKGVIVSSGANAGRMSYSGADGIGIYFQSAFLSRTYDFYAVISIDYTPHSCSYSTTSETAATCLNAGSRTKKCSVCGATTTETIPALGHSFGSTTAAKAATCLATGNSAYKKCSRCNLYFAGSAATNATGGKSDTSSFVIAKLSHSYTGAIKSDGNGKDATHSFKCVNGCNNYGGAVKHTWNSGVQTTAPTCTTAGVKTYTCTASGCGGTYTESIPATGHSWKTPTYSWSSDGKTCTATRVCSKDSSHKETATATITSAVKTAATCTVKGTTRYTATFGVSWATTQTKDVQDIAAKGHTWVNATCTAPKTCSVCGATEGSALGHSYTSKVTAPTATAGGYTTYTCSRCGHSYKDNYTFLITANSNNNNYGTVSGGGTYNQGATATLTATAKPCYKFVKWNDGNTSATRTVTVSASATYTATFEADPPEIISVTITRSSDLANVSISAPVDAGAKFIISVEVT